MATWDHHVLVPSPEKYREKHLAAGAILRSSNGMGAWSASSRSPHRSVPTPFTFAKPSTYTLRGNRYLVRPTPPKWAPLAPTLRPEATRAAEPSADDMYRSSLAQIYSGHQPPASPRALSAIASPRTMGKTGKVFAGSSGLWPHQNSMSGIKSSQNIKNADRWVDAGVSPPWTHPRGSFYPQLSPRVLQF